MSRELTDVGAASDLPEGEMLGVTLPEGEVVCLFNHRGTIGAVGGRCTHAEFDMADGVLRDDGTIECVWHGARFDCRTGAVRRHPATEPLPVYSVHVEQGRILLGALEAIPTERRR
jgi:nitrite reductase/ring-hydroxylating ferredoxin subunit